MNDPDLLARQACDRSPLASPPISVSVIVPVYNGGDNFRRCLVSLREAVPRPYEIIVVADGDTDGSREVARAYGARVLVNATPGGPAKARNLGARAARGTILFFVDADVTIPPDAIGFIETLYHHEPALAACIGSYDDAPAAPNFLSQYKNLLHHYVHQMGRKEASTFWGACGTIRRDIFLKLGGFDERYTTPCIEDIELGYRLVRDGYQIQLCKELQVKHLKRWEAYSLLYADFFRRAIPWTELILRDRRMVNDLNLQHSGRLSVVSAYGLLSALVAAVIWPRMLACAGACGVSLVLLNASLYRFFIHKRGLWFALRAIPWHWLYFLYSGLAFGIGVLRFLGSRPSDSRARDKR